MSTSERQQKKLKFLGPLDVAAKDHKRKLGNKTSLYDVQHDRDNLVDKEHLIQYLINTDSSGKNSTLGKKVWPSRLQQLNIINEQSG